MKPFLWLLVLPLQSVLPLSFAPVQFSTSESLTAPMEAPPQAQYGAPLEPLGFGSAQPESDPGPGPDAERDYLRGSQFAPDGTSSAGSSTPISSLAAEEEESLVDSQPICFKENPFLVANRRGKGRPAGQQVLSGPPVGYGKGGQLQPWLFNKASRLPACGVEAAWCVYTVPVGSAAPSPGPSNGSLHRDSPDCTEVFTLKRFIWTQRSTSHFLEGYNRCAHPFRAINRKCAHQFLTRWVLWFCTVGGKEVKH